MAEGCVTSLAFGNKRKRILFAHTQENSSSTPRAPLLPRSLWSLPAPLVMAARPSPAMGSGVQHLAGRGLGFPAPRAMRERKGQTQVRASRGAPPWYK